MYRAVMFITLAMKQKEFIMIRRQAYENKRQAETI
jgi:hypothetical protein